MVEVESDLRDVIYECPIRLIHQGKFARCSSSLLVDVIVINLEPIHAVIPQFPSAFL